MGERLEVSREIAASPADVYAAISDVTRMGEWSRECHSCRWHDGVDGPAVGAVFDGHNRNGDHEWITQGTVVEADQGRSFVFDCSMHGVHYATWGYRIEPTAGGCRVTEWTEDLRTEQARAYAVRVSGVDDRVARNRETMTGTLDRIAAAVEG
ncbi:SRPBCC family protein [Rhodococcus sp. NPDC058505]|uniref:SRPBCC family protein n=1 Tax=unclassified Rhodococcus (in: high G+C Gram-positive bacteria) TaxID=192944 RepID=UPI003648F3B1